MRDYLPEIIKQLHNLPLDQVGAGVLACVAVYPSVRHEFCGKLGSWCGGVGSGGKRLTCATGEQKTQRRDKPPAALLCDNHPAH